MSLARPYHNGSKPIPHKVVTSDARAQTEPANGGFMNLMMRKGENDLDEGVQLDDQPNKKLTQEQQDEEDEKERKRAMKNLVNSWQERLQLISVITTFFASTEAGMLVNTKPITADDMSNGALRAANVSFLGALIMHVYAAVLSFLAAFLLIRYKLKEATREELIVEGIKMVASESPLEGPMRVKDIERDLQDSDGPTAIINEIEKKSTMPTRAGTMSPQTEPQARSRSLPAEPPILSKNPHLEQVGPFMSNISSHLLSRIHALCVFFAAIGFVLAIAGIVLYAWALQPVEVKILTTACLGVAMLATVTLLI
ncbi:hypothetical protein HYDPIDRAFT_27242 [Hydnomerulius pinastri MD-312]|nr:hypothetical protein HYDPIDRAFT_27242 [Hydnomerulius pinastri MD-312]